MSALFSARVKPGPIGDSVGGPSDFDVVCDQARVTGIDDDARPTTPTATALSPSKWVSELSYSFILFCYTGIVARRTEVSTARLIYLPMILMCRCYTGIFHYRTEVSNSKLVYWPVALKWLRPSIPIPIINLLSER